MRTPSRGRDGRDLPGPLTALDPGGVAAATQHRPTPTCDGRPATLVGTNGKDRLVGTPGPDVIVALRGNDVVFGLGGDDVLCGDGGRDVLLGGAGDDRLYGGTDFQSYNRGGTFLNGDDLVGGPGDDVLDVGVDPRRVDAGVFGNYADYAGSGSGITVHLAAHGTGTATGAAIGHDRIVGRPTLQLRATAHDDVIVGSRVADRIDAGDGDDVVDGRGGDDEIAPDAPYGTRSRHDDDVVHGGAGDDQVYSYLGRDRLHGGPGDDALVAYSAQPEVLRGDGGDDGLTSYLTPASGWDVDGGAGAHDDLTLYLPTGASASSLLTIDERSGDAGIAYATPSTGRILSAEWVTVFDALPVDFHGTDASEHLTTGLVSGTGRLHADMGGGNDLVYSGEGDDVVDGGPGVDTVHGGPGADRCPHTEHADSCAVG